MSGKWEYLARTSQLHNLKQLGIMRVGWRLENIQMSFGSMHPIIFPKDQHVTRLLVQNYQQIQGHSGPSQVLASIRQRFWVIQGLSVVRSILAGSMECYKRNARPGEHTMAPLPRVAPSDPPFTRVGVDYLGQAEAWSLFVHMS